MTTLHTDHVILNWTLHESDSCCMQDAAETREAFSALKSQFIAHHDMLDAKERELVRRDLKVQELLRHDVNLVPTRGDSINPTRSKSMPYTYIASVALCVPIAMHCSCDQLAGCCRRYLQSPVHVDGFDICTSN